MKQKRAQRKEQKKVELFSVLVLVATLFMSIAYAQISAVKLEVTGEIEAELQEGIFIEDVNKTSSTGVVSDEIKYFKGTTLSSSIELSSSTSSSVTYTVSLYNNYGETYYFKNVAYDKNAYSNDNITFVLDGLKPYVTTIAPTVDPTKTQNFNIEFKYVDKFTPTTSQILDSMLAFVFSNEMIEFKVADTIYTAPKGATWEQFVESEYNTYEFEIVDDKVYTSDGKMLLYREKSSELNTEVKAADVISESIEYIHEITFKIADLVFTADQGMTINEWIVSDYLELPFTKSENASKDNIVVKYNSEDYYIVSANETNIPGTTIINNKDEFKLKGTITSSTENNYTLELYDTVEGTASNYIIYGNSIQNGTPSPTNPEEILSVGDKTKNLINEKEISISSGYYYDSTGSESNADSRFIKLDPIKVESNTTYTLSCNLKIYTVWFFNDNNSISKENIEAKEKSFTTPENCNQIRISLYNTSGIADTSAFEWIQLEEGTEATEYEPYGKYKIPIKFSNQNGESSITNIYLDEPLRKVGSYTDYIDFSTGKVVRNVRNLSLNISDMNNSEDYPGWKNDVNTILYEEFPNVNGYIPTGILSNITTDVYKIGINTMYSHSVTLWLRKSSFNLTQTDWKTNYPDLVFDLYYGMLKSDDTETIELPELQIFKDYTKIEVLTEVAPSRMEVECQQIISDLTYICLDKTKIKAEIISGETATDAVSVLLTNAEGSPTWTSSNTSVAEVTGSGNTATVTLKAGGTAKITVSYGDYSATCNVTVTEKNLISFTINGITYYAEPNMNFGQWISSSYNTLGAWFASDGFIYAVVPENSTGYGMLCHPNAWRNWSK